MADDAPLISTAPTPPSPPPPFTVRTVFMGKDGLRAGWGLLIYLLIVIAIGLCVTAIMHKVHPAWGESPHAGAEIPPSFILPSELIPFLVVLLGTWIMSKIEGRP